MYRRYGRYYPYHRPQAPANNNNAPFYNPPPPQPGTVVQSNGKMICEICKQSLLAAIDIQRLNPPPYRRTRARNIPDDSRELRCTPCGHVFHKVCLISFFRRHSVRWIRRPMSLSGNCPKCQRYCTMRTVYPVDLGFGGAAAANPAAGNNNTGGQKRDIDSRMEEVKKQCKQMQKMVQVLTGRKRKKMRKVDASGAASNLEVDDQAEKETAESNQEEEKRDTEKVEPQIPKTIDGAPQADVGTIAEPISDVFDDTDESESSGEFEDDDEEDEDTDEE